MNNLYIRFYILTQNPDARQGGRNLFRLFILRAEGALHLIFLDLCRHCVKGMCLIISGIILFCFAHLKFLQ